MVDPEYMENLYTGGSRMFDPNYRSRSTFVIPLVYSEYLSIILPFVMFRAFVKRTIKDALLPVGIYVLVLLGMLASGSRSAIISFLIAHGVWILLVAVRTRIANRHSLISAAVTFMYPIGIAVFGLVLMSSHTLYVSVVGGGQHQASNDARSMQWEMGIAALKTTIVGYGAGQATSHVGYTNLAGKPVLDSYILTLLGDYGYFGMIAFFTIFITLVILCLRGAMQSSTLSRIGLPLGTALLVFLSIRPVLSAEVNMPITISIAALALAYLRLLKDQTAVAGANETQSGYDRPRIGVLIHNDR